MEIYKFIKSYLIKYQIYLFILFATAIIFRILQYAMPYVAGNYVDKLIYSKQYDDVLRMSILIIILSFTRMAGTFFSSYYSTVISSKVAHDITVDIINHILKVPFTLIKNYDSGYLTQRVQQDSNTIVTFFVNNIVGLIVRIITLLIILYLCLRIATLMTLLVLMVIPIYIYIYNLMKKYIYSAQHDFLETNNEYYSVLSMALRNIKNIKINSSFNEVEQLINRIYRKSFSKLVVKTKRSLNYQQVNGIILLFVNGIIYYFGGKSVIDGRMTIGEFTIINSYFNMIFVDLNFFLGFGESYQNSLVSYNRLMSLQNIKKEQNGDKKADEISKISVKDLNFKYDPNDCLIKNFGYEFNKGNIYAIIGENGSGKTTFINLLLGIYNGFYSGTIKYNDNNIIDLDLYDTRQKHIAVCLQDISFIFNSVIGVLSGSFADKEVINLEEISNKLELFNITLEGIRIDEDVNNLSGGERQKIQLVSSILKEVEVLILDEPSSALDEPNKITFFKALQRIKEDKIIIVITHDRALMNISDYIINFDKLH